MDRDQIIAAKAGARTVLRQFAGGPTAAMTAIEEIPALADALLRVLDLHWAEWPIGRQWTKQLCSTCDVPYPCATVRAIQGGE